MAETNVECGKFRILPIKQRIMRWEDNDPMFETTSKIFRCEREPGHGGDHLGKEDTEGKALVAAFWKDDETP